MRQSAGVSAPQRSIPTVEEAEEILRQARNLAEIKRARKIIDTTIENALKIGSALKELKTLTTQSEDGKFCVIERSFFDSTYQKLLQTIDIIAQQADKASGPFTSHRSTVQYAGHREATAQPCASILPDTFMEPFIGLESSAGFNHGICSSVKIVPQGQLAFVEVTLSAFPTDGMESRAKEQIYYGTISLSYNDGYILRTKDDNHSALVLRLNPRAPHINDFDALTNVLKSALKRDSFTMGAVFHCKSTPLPNYVNITTSSTAEPGIYALSYFANRKELTLLTYGKSWSTIIESLDTETIQLNGINIYLDTNFPRDKDFGQSVFKIERPCSPKTLTITVNSSNISLNIAALNTESLGLAGTDVTSQTNARTSYYLVENAILQVNQAIMDCRNFITSLSILEDTEPRK